MDNAKSLYNVNASAATPIANVIMPRADGLEDMGNIDFAALKREILFLHSVERVGKSDKWNGVVGHFGLQRKLAITLYGKDIRMIETAYGIQIADSHEFTEPVEFFANQYIGTAFKGIKLLNGHTFTETVQTVEVQTVPASDTPKPKYHGETVTILSAVQQDYGTWKVWTLMARATDGFFFRKITAWGEHRTLFIDAGYPKFPERGEPAIQLNADAVIEYVEGKINDYRVKHVYPKDSSHATETVLTVVETPVRHVIAVTVELTLEEQIAALYRKQDYTVAGILELVADAVQPARQILVSMAAGDDSKEAAA